MSLGVEVPLLKGLPRVEQARLAGDLERLDLQEGDQLVTGGGDGWVYFVVKGDVEIIDLDGDIPVPLMLLGDGDVIGETAWQEGAPRIGIRALGSTQLVRLPISRFQRLLRAEPALAREFAQAITARSAGSLRELARTKRLLSAYAVEVWESAPSPVVSAAVMAPTQTAEHGRQRWSHPPLHKVWSTHLKRFSVVLVPLLVVGASFSLGAGDLRLTTAIAILGSAASLWLMGQVTDYVIALAASVAAVLFNVAKPSVAFSGFANPAWFLLLGILGMGVAVNQSGLLYRLALTMLRLLPPTYRGQSFALALTGLLFTPLLPSANSRSALASPLAKELSDAMRFPALGRGSAGLAMSAFLGFGQMYFLFFNGTNICLLAWSLMPGAIQSQVTWIYWFLVALPLGLISFVGSYGAILWLFPPEPTAGVSRQTIEAQLKVLGALSNAERRTAAVLGVVLTGFLTQSIHGVNPSWIALSGFLILVVLGVIDKQGLKSIDWGFLLLVGGLISLSDVTQATGLSVHLAQWVGVLLQPVAHSPILFLAGVSLLMLLVRLAIPIQQAVLLMVISLLPMTMELGYSPFVIVLVVLAMSNSWILPQQNQMYLTVYSGTEERCFSHKQVRTLALVQAAFGILAVLVSVPYWQLLGLLPW
ncbi:MAG: SLC13 family permease [Bacillota bacterium]